MKRKKSNKIHSAVFKQLARNDLLQCSTILGTETVKLIKGGITCELTNNQLRFEIVRCLSTGTFPNRIERLQDFLVDKYPMDIPEEFEVDPVDRVRELIEEIRNNFECLSNEQMLKVLTDWVENPQSDNCCYEELDAIAETLGFNYEEVDGEVVLIIPSPESLAKKVVSMSDAEFYHSVIALAGLGLPSRESLLPPSICCAGYEFLENLVERLRVISKLL